MKENSDITFTFYPVDRFLFLAQERRISHKFSSKEEGFSEILEELVVMNEEYQDNFGVGLASNGMSYDGVRMDVSKVEAGLVTKSFVDPRMHNEIARKIDGLYGERQHASVEEVVRVLLPQFDEMARLPWISEKPFYL